MNRKRWDAAVCVLLVGLMVFLAGCQTVSGVDLTQILSKSFTVSSAESRQTVTVEFIKDPSVDLTQEQQAALELFGKLKLNVTESKMQDPMHVSLKGTLEYGKGSIPFQLVMTNQAYTLQVEGAKKPIVIRNQPPAGAEAGVPALSQELRTQLEQLGKKAVEAAPKLGSFFARNLPNPPVVSVSKATYTVNGENLALTRIHGEIYGDDLVALVKSFLTSVLADEQGLKDFISVLYDLYAPILQQAMKDSGGESGTSPMAEEIKPYLENKTLAVEFISTFLRTQIEKLLTNYDQDIASFLASEEGAEVKAVFSDKLYLKADYYVDGDFSIRKSDVEFGLTLPEGKGNGLKGFKITSSSEAWNINKPVTIATIDTSNGVYDLNETNGRMTAGRFLAGIDPNSQLYKPLKDDLHVTKKEINMFMSDKEDLGLYSPGSEPYNDNGTVMVPARFVTERARRRCVLGRGREAGYDYRPA
ncbi:hypothetical protein LJK87_27870 [Paenibacillus sp. P25]|nr:hypothetical protein LJK87_27870 [Paenibacillus sp. P25]